MCAPLCCLLLKDKQIWMIANLSTCIIIIGLKWAGNAEPISGLGASINEMQLPSATSTISSGFDV